MIRRYYFRNESPQYQGEGNTMTVIDSEVRTEVNREDADRRLIQNRIERTLRLTPAEMTYAENAAKGHEARIAELDSSSREAVQAQRQRTTILLQDAYVREFSDASIYAASQEDTDGGNRARSHLRSRLLHLGVPDEQTSGVLSDVLIQRERGHIALRERLREVASSVPLPAWEPFVVQRGLSLAAG